MFSILGRVFLKLSFLESRVLNDAGSDARPNVTCLQGANKMQQASLRIHREKYKGIGCWWKWNRGEV